MTSRETAAKLKSNIWIIYVANFLKGLMFFLPIYALYLQQELFTVFNVALIISIQSVFVILLEVPSGAIADLFGRKNTLIVANIVAIIALIFLSIGTSLIFFIGYAIFIALSESLNSGTDIAILFDSIKNVNKEAKKEAIALSKAAIESKTITPLSTDIHFKKVIGINSSMWQIGASISAVIGGVLAGQYLRLPIYATIIPFILALILTFFITEPQYQKEKHSNILTHISKSGKLFIKKKQLLILFVAGFLFFAFGEVEHQLNAIFFSFKGIPIEYFGLIFALIFGLSSLGFLISHAVSSKFGNKSTVIISEILSILLIFIATLTFGIWTSILIIISSLFWGIRGPIITHLTNLETASKNRATIISIGNLGNRLGLAICVPIFGIISDIYNINFVFQLTSGLSFTAVFVLLFLKDKN
jgi:MFS family permease